MYRHIKGLVQLEGYIYNSFAFFVGNMPLYLLILAVIVLEYYGRQGE